MASRAAGSLTCHFCQRKFNKGEHLRRHVRTHTREKPFKCNCGQSFTRRDLLTRHERIYHPATVDRGPLSKTGGSTIVPSEHEQGVRPAQGNVIEPSPANADTGSDLHVGYEPSTDSLLWSPEPAFANISDFMDVYNLDFNFNLDPQLDNAASDVFDNAMGENSRTPGLRSTLRHNNEIRSVRIPNTSAGDDEFYELKPLAYPCAVREPQRASFMTSLEPFQKILGSFKLPSRMSLTRYITGYVDGFSSHHPFIHIPTFSITKYLEAPEAILALLAVGAQFRYEYGMAGSLYKAARSIVLHRIETGELARLASTSSTQTASIRTRETGPDCMHIVGAVLLLATYSSWQHNDRLVREALDYQAILGRCIRDHGLREAGRFEADSDDWESWVCAETNRRTKLSAFCFLNMQSQVFCSPPVLLAKDIHLQLPSSCKEWVASSQEEWLHARTEFASPVTFQVALAALLQERLGSLVITSPFGNFALAHALLQRITIARQLTAARLGIIPKLPGTAPIEESLHRWRDAWHAAPESDIDTRNSTGSLSWSSTSLLGLAHIRLHFRIGDDSFDYFDKADRIARNALDARSPRRGPHLLHAVLHAVHGLKVPVQEGLTYLTNCKALFWSLQHAFSAFESAIFLHKWLTLFTQVDADPPNDIERQLIECLASLVQEALDTVDDFSVPNGAFSTPVPAQYLGQLGRVVVQLFAYMFVSSNNVWPITRVIGTSLNMYVALLDSEPIDRP